MIRLWIILVTLALFSSSCALEVEADGELFFNEMQKFREGDDPAWASDEYDDSSWKLIRVSESWQAQNIAPDNKIGWYRFHFTAPQAWKDRHPAVFLGRIGDADEVYLNGVKIGGEGIIGNRFIEATDVVRLYPLPEEHLIFGRSNVLAVRVMNTYVRGGIFESQVIIGNHQELLMSKLEAEYSRKGIQLIYLFFYALVIAFILLRYIAGVKDREYIGFAFFILCYSLYWSFTCLSFYQSGMKTHFIQKLVYAFPALFPASIIYFLSAAFRERLTIIPKTVAIFSFVLFFAYLLFLGNPKYLRILDIMWITLIFLLNIIMLYLCIQAYRRQINESGPLIAGAVILMLTANGELLQWTYLADYGTYFFTSPAEIGVLVMVLCVAYAMELRFARCMKSETLFSQRLLSAHDEERKRIAADLNGGLGQIFSTLRQKIQKLAGKMSGLQNENLCFPELVTDLSMAIHAVRQISMELRPSVLETMETGDLVRWYGERFQARTGIAVAMNVDAGLHKAERKTKEHLYRILQEALGNVEKHSGATDVHLRLTTKRGLLSIRIADNGTGFDAENVLMHNHGLGLRIMRERAEILDGSFMFRSAIGMGTEIAVEVPLQ